MSRHKYTQEQIEFILTQRSADFTWKEIAEHFNDIFGIDRSWDCIRKAHDSADVYIPEAPPKILVYDIETAPMLGFVWGLWDNNVALNQLHSDWYILSWSAKWLGSKEILYMDQRNAKDIEDDTKVLEGIWKLLDEADIVITHNGKSFDQKKLYARFVLKGMRPPSSSRHIDTKQIASRYFKFTSNKLEYLSNNLGTKYKKSKHAKFSGFELWRECLAGNLGAWKEMQHYNKYDVLALEEVYKKLIPWDNTIDFSVYFGGEARVCSCGSRKFTNTKYEFTNTAVRRKLTCTFCGRELRDKANLLPKDKKASLGGRTTR